MCKHKLGNPRLHHALRMADPEGRGGQPLAFLMLFARCGGFIPLPSPPLSLHNLDLVALVSLLCVWGRNAF